MKTAPKKVKLCPTCKKLDENIDDLPQFVFKKKETSSKQISIISKKKVNKKLKTLF
jgi:hypothetical protein